MTLGIFQNVKILYTLMNMNKKKKLLLQQLRKVKIEKEKLEKFIEQVLTEEKNMEKIFSKTILISTQFKFLDNLQDKEQIIDAIGYNLEEDFIIIFEWKRKEDPDHINQGRTYFNALTHQ